MRHAPLLFAAALVAGCGAATQPPAGPDSTPPPPANRAPRLLAFPATVDHDLTYDVVLTATDPDGDAVVVTVPLRPSWLSWDAGTQRLTGTPGESRIGTAAPLVTRIWDDEDTVITSFTLQVRLGTSRLIFDGRWIAQAQHPFGHDSTVIQTEHFLLFSDFSSMETRQALATMLEAHYDTLAARLGVASDAEYEFPPEGRLHVYADKYQGDSAYGYNQTVMGWAFRDGFIAMAADAPRYGPRGYTPERYSGLVMHEFMHTVEFMLIGRARSIGSTDSWFREGIATFMPGRAPGGPLVTSATRSMAAQWRAQYAGATGQGNPIAIHTFADLPAGLNPGAFYFWFAQGVRYLWDPAGFGLGYAGLRGIYDDIRAGMTFAESFLGRTGITLAQFEAEFWDRMDAFLPP